MPKKLKLSNIKVQSFVTSLGDDAKNKVKGGAPTYEPDCTQVTCMDCTDTCESLCLTQCATCYTCTCDTSCGCSNTCGSQTRCVACQTAFC